MESTEVPIVPEAVSPELPPVLYAEIRRLASAALRKERHGGTLRTTALAHEAWFRLQDQRAFASAGREQVLALAAQAIRRVLIDHARRRKASCRGGGAFRVELTEDLAQVPVRDEELLALDAALEGLRLRHERQARVVELRWFGGLDVSATARVLGISPRSVEGDWAVARAWLRREIERSRA